MTLPASRLGAACSSAWGISYTWSMLESTCARPVYLQCLRIAAIEYGVSLGSQLPLLVFVMVVAAILGGLSFSLVVCIRCPIPESAFVSRIWLRNFQVCYRSFLLWQCGIVADTLWQPTCMEFMFQVKHLGHEINRFPSTCIDTSQQWLHGCPTHMLPRMAPEYMILPDAKLEHSHWACMEFLLHGSVPKTTC